MVTVYLLQTDRKVDTSEGNSKFLNQFSDSVYGQEINCPLSISLGGGK